MRSSACLADARAWPELWQRAASASRRALILDFDGTLAPFSIDRAAVGLPPDVHRLLEAIASRGADTLGVVSGRSLVDLEERFRGIPALLVGEHGWDESFPDGTGRRHQLPALAATMLERTAESLALHVPAGLLERKRASVVLHTRGQPEDLIRNLEAELDRCRRSLIRHAELEIRAIDGGWELRARGRDKGTAVAAIAARLGGRTFVVYVGDDETDEDAFAAVSRFGFGVRVGNGDQVTRAHARLPDVAAVAVFLEIWAARFAATSMAGAR